MMEKRIKNPSVTAGAVTPPLPREASGGDGGAIRGTLPTGDGRRCAGTSSTASGPPSPCAGKAYFSEETRELLARADKALDDRPRCYGETILEREELAERLLRACSNGNETLLFWMTALFSACLENVNFDFWKTIRDILYFCG